MRVQLGLGAVFSVGVEDAMSTMSARASSPQVAGLSVGWICVESSAVAVVVCFQVKVCLSMMRMGDVDSADVEIPRPIASSLRPTWVCAGA